MVRYRVLFFIIGLLFLGVASLDGHMLVKLVIGLQSIPFFFFAAKGYDDGEDW